MKVSFYTLGCKVNQYETQAMQQFLISRGHTLVPFGEPCELCIINTCTVTAISDKKCRNAVRRARKDCPDAVIGVCGCYAQNAPDELRALGVDVLAGTMGRLAFAELLEKTAADRQKRELYEPAREHHSFEPLPAGGMAERTRALLKVEDGCNNFCTYCIIPYARGPVRSLPLADAVRETVRCREEGYRELTVTGIELSSWRDGEYTPAELIAAVCEAAGTMRIRLGSLEPRTVTPEFCELLSGRDNLCPHFHLSLQSGSDEILRRMNRKYDTARFTQSVELLRAAFPGCAITTDVIAGFPGETEELWTETMAFLKKTAFAACHIFPYSRRKGTRADRMDGQLTMEQKERRAREAIALAAQCEKEYLRGCVGTVQSVLWEQTEDGYAVGHAPNYAKVYLPRTAERNTVDRCRIVGLYRDGLLAEKI